MGCGTDSKEETTMPAYKDKVKGTWYASFYWMQCCSTEKCVLLTDKSSKTEALSVILPWIFA